MKIALFGYGKMGKIVEETALKRGHSIGERIDSDTAEIDISGADVAIDFSIPAAALKNISVGLEQEVPVISGTTGWIDDYEKAVKLCNEKNGAFMYASNFSLGVQLFFRLNGYLADMMKDFPEYAVSMEEIHHAQKTDAPSGTAIRLAEDIIARGSKTGWQLDVAEAGEIPVTAKRTGTVPGTHSIRYAGGTDSIEIKHTAHNREGFALGAVMAAEWIIGKKGVFTLKDMLNMGE